MVNNMFKWKNYCLLLCFVTSGNGCHPRCSTCSGWKFRCILFHYKSRIFSSMFSKFSDVQLNLTSSERCLSFCMGKIPKLLWQKKNNLKLIGYLFKPPIRCQLRIKTDQWAHWMSQNWLLETHQLIGTFHLSSKCPGCGRQWILLTSWNKLQRQTFSYNSCAGRSALQYVSFYDHWCNKYWHWWCIHTDWDRDGDRDQEQTGCINCAEVFTLHLNQDRDWVLLSHIVLLQVPVPVSFPVLLSVNIPWVLIKTINPTDQLA